MISFIHEPASYSPVDINDYLPRAQSKFCLKLDTYSYNTACLGSKWANYLRRAVITRTTCTTSYQGCMQQVLLYQHIQQLTLD